MPWWALCPLPWKTSSKQAKNRVTYPRFKSGTLSASGYRPVGFREEDEEDVFNAQWIYTRDRNIAAEKIGTGANVLVDEPEEETTAIARTDPVASGTNKSADRKPARKQAPPAAYARTAVAI